MKLRTIICVNNEYENLLNYLAASGGESNPVEIEPGFVIRTPVPTTVRTLRYICGGMP